MNRRKLINILTEYGYSYVRNCRHGELWKKGQHVFLLAREASFDDPRAIRNQLALLKRQLKMEVAG